MSHIPLSLLESLRDHVDALARSARRQAVHMPDYLLAPFDGGPRLRPHTIPGWWQVWSGGICIALLSPKDVAPIVEAKR